MWKQPERLRTLARIAFHQRQFETWWKFELATHLWDLAAQLDAAVFVECLGRADVVLACVKEGSGVTQIDMCRSPRIPIELKTLGTWWGSASINKAYQESGKKTLAQDMDNARERRRPLPVGVEHDPRDLGTKYGLTELINERIELPLQSEGQATAQQILWIARS
jgi:hypothetical protein